MQKVKLTRKVKEDNYIDKCQRKRYKSLFQLPMTAPKSRDKLDSTLTPNYLTCSRKEK